MHSYNLLFCSFPGLGGHYLWYFLGDLDRGGGAQMFLSILRNAHVACHYCVFMPMSPCDLKQCLCPLSLYYFQSPCCMSLGLMSTVEFKKRPCRRVDFRGPPPFSWLRTENISLGIPLVQRARRVRTDL